MEMFGVHILGFSPGALHKWVLTGVVVAAAILLRWILQLITPTAKASRRRIWARKFTRMAVSALAVLALLSIWFDNPGRLATFSGLVVAGAAVASQNAILSAAGYLVIVFGKVFDLGDRIQIGDVRGDVLDIGLFKTTVMEMGVPQVLQPDPNHWVGARQYSGRVVTFTNAELFRTATYNYTRMFNFLWEELHVPVPYEADLRLAEQLVSEAVSAVTQPIIDEGRRQLSELQKRFVIHGSDLEPRIYLRLTDNWIELSVRFLVRSWGVRDVKDALSRRILAAFQAHGLSIASSTFEITKLPELRFSGPGERPEHAPDQPPA
jgi:small-conductance mechanosensitive channel